MNSHLFIKYLQNRCSDEELEEVIRWFRADADKISGRVFLNRFWETIKIENGEKLDADANNLLHRIHHDINRQDAEKLIRKSSGNPNRYIKRKKVLYSLMRIAAVLFIPLLLFTVYISFNQAIHQEEYSSKSTQNTHVKIHSPNGVTSQFTLPDGTMVWLNRNTTLIYPVKFTKNLHQVRLTGEAYFKVKNIADSPFKVNTGELTIVATGTEFNVKAFPEIPRIETTLKTGKVLLQKRSSEGKVITFLEMHPDEHAIYHVGTKKLDCSKEDIDKYIMWREGRLVFENDPLFKVTEQLELFYNADIEIQDSTLSEITYTATFEDETLSQVLELLKITAPLDYTLLRSHKKEDGTFSKRKVIIKYENNNVY